MEYSGSMFSTTAKSHLNKLDIIQRKATRIKYKLRRNVHAVSLLIFLSLDDLTGRREARLLKLIKYLVKAKCHPTMTALVQV